MSTAVYWLLALAAFLLEVALLAGVGFAAYRAPGVGSTALKIVLTVLAVAAFAAFWAVFMAPNAAHRLPTWPRAALAGGLCLGAGSALALTGFPAWGVALGFGGIVLSAAQLGTAYLDNGSAG